MSKTSDERAKTSPRPPRRSKAFAAALGAAATVLLAMSSPLPAAEPVTVDEDLRAIQKSLSGGGCRETGFVQTYVPNGFATGRGQSGRLVLHPPDRIRFEYAEPKGRLFAMAGSTATLVDPASKVVTRRPISADERARYPIFDLAVGKRPAGFRLERKLVDGETRLEATPIEANDEIAWGAVILTKDRKSVRRLEWKDTEGNVNRFDLALLRPLAECPDALFSPATPAGFRAEDDRPAPRR